jgi:hypothetical protein
VSVFERLDSAIFDRWPPQEVLGAVAVAVGSLVATTAFGACIALQVLEDVL